MEFRVTIYHSILSPTGTIVKLPVGWDDCKLVLERHPDYHSLIEYFEGDFIFFGDSYELLRSIENGYGVDAKPRIIVEVSTTINLWEEIFDGLIDLSLLEEFSLGNTFYKMKAPIVRNDFWTKFINRKSIPIDLSSTTDLDGVEVDAIASTTLALPYQIINTSYEARMYSSTDENRAVIEYAFDAATDAIAGNISLPVKVKNLVEDVQSISPTVVTLDSPSGWGYKLPKNFIARYKGSYTLDLHLVMSTSPYSVPFGGGDKVSTVLQVEIYKNGILQSLATDSDFGTNGVDGRTTFVYTQTFDLEIGDNLIWDIEYFGGASGSYYIVFNDWFPGQDSYIKLDASTTFLDSEAEGFKVLDAARSIISKITGINEPIEHDSLSDNMEHTWLAPGLQVRGFSLADKPMAMSFDQWWSGLDPIFNLYLAYSEEDNKIILGKKVDGYDPSPSINLVGVANMIRTYDLDMFTRSIEVGYDKWSYESNGGLDDPQTKRTWRTSLASLGKDVKQLSEFIAASLVLERVRRNQGSTGKDDKLDNEIFVVSLTSIHEVELGTSFESVSGLLNADTRYNIRLSCARNFERWRSWYNGCFQYDLTQKYFYASGEGNVLMSSEISVGDRDYSENPTLIENQDIDVSSDFVTIPKKYTFTHPLSLNGYKQIRLFKDKAIGITTSSTAVNVFPYFIEKVSYKIAKGEADFSVWKARETEVSGGIFDETFDTTFE